MLWEDAVKMLAGIRFFIRSTLVAMGLIFGGGQVMSQDIFAEDLLSKYRGKNVLLVNIATRCGYTPQLEALEKIHQKYKEQNFTVVGIPSNDFGQQTPEKDEEVVSFCKLKYGVSFPLTSKTSVRGAGKHPLIEKLIGAGEEKSEIKWNFEKFLIDRSGKIVERYKSDVKPDSDEVIKRIEELLKL